MEAGGEKTSRKFHHCPFRSRNRRTEKNRHHIRPQVWESSRDEAGTGSKDESGCTNNKVVDFLRSSLPEVSPTQTDFAHTGVAWSRQDLKD